MAETDVHRRLMLDLLHALEEHFREQPRVYVSGNIFLYYLDEKGIRRSVSPDILVVFGIEKKERRIYKLEAEGKAPDVVIELTSDETKVNDLGDKRYIYATLGVREYFIFDPLQETMRPPLRGFRLEQGDYVPLMGSRINSEVLGLELRVEQNTLRLYDRKTGKRLLTPTEAEAARREAEARAEHEARERRAAEGELARLREELKKLRGE
ncbi:MAG: Uma2 family endonuclease [candidate division KSB1 bacterium]|nr:Uma2 family endonuclease [candidate division KSB1 bacterium]MDZ7273393.1 Uma2 family endonuclease [candidate division KSB1 bacterium]MDZ7288055.1 Uma2 family endonuclease [candidate division KSB1 bacterium]MDZ7300093.1 Uma2 family endonuclease [candidate division KSB1 bacterium]MDZ7307217.1 Uma2 family endonuclease [candidate division KSB1 bacterium]